MAGYSLREVEDAVLKALAARLGDFIKTVKSFQGNWQDELRQGAVRLPAALVVLKSSRAQQVGVSSFDLVLEFEVLAVVRGLRGEAVGRRDEGGMYDLMAGIREALWYQDLGLAILPLALGREEPLLNTQEYCVHASLYRTGIVQDLAG